MSDSERETYLSELHIAVLAVTAEGRPPASYPIWYDYAPGGDIRIKTSAGTRKTRLIDAAGEVSLTVQDEKPPYKYVIVEGTIAEKVEPAPVEVQEEIAIRYLGEEAGRNFVEQMGDPGVLYVITPKRWITADFSGEM